MSLARKIRCEVTLITNHSSGVYSLELKPEGTVPLFRPGQFLHLTVDEYDPSSFWPESRVFSIASSPRDRRHLRICYSVKGRYTAKMERELVVGSHVWVKMPYGEFLGDATGDMVMIAGGTGISAFSGLIESLKPDHQNDVYLAYGVRSPELMLFSNLLMIQLNKVPRFKVILFVESGNQAAMSLSKDMPKHPNCFPGRISLDAVWGFVAQPAAKPFYLSGPPGMITALTTGLLDRGVPPKNVFRDAWE